MDGQADFQAPFIVRARWPVLLRTAYLLTADPHLADDLLRDTHGQGGLAVERSSRSGPPGRMWRALVTGSHRRLAAAGSGATADARYWFWRNRFRRPGRSM